MSEPRQVTEEGLVRGIGTWALGANIINMVVGAGIFVLPGIVAAALGPAAILAYLLCAVTVALVFLCFAEVGGRFSRSGGSYAYIEEAFGPFAGFIASTLLWLGWSILADAAMAVAMVDVLATRIPVLGEPLPRAAFLVALFGFMAYINVAGLKSGLRLSIFNTIAKLIPLLVLLAAGLFAINFDNLRITTLPSLQDFGAAALILFFAFAGAETALNSSGEIRDPTRTVPRGLLLGVSGIFILYVGLQVVAQGTLGSELANNTDTPLVATATAVLGSWGAQLLLIGTVISMFGCISGDILTTPRVVFAAARDGLLPRVFARVHPKHQTPWIAIMAYAAIGCAFALSGTFRQLAVVASGSILLVYLGVSLAVIRLRQRDGVPGKGMFRLPGGPTIPLLSAAVVVWLLSRMTMNEATGVAILVILAALIYGGRFLFLQSAKS